MSKHSPGPWIIVRDRERGLFIKDEKHSLHIASMPRWGPTHDVESASNARLIAAAPEMLSVLKALIGEESLPGSGYRIAKDVIAKAEGK